MCGRGDLTCLTAPTSPSVFSEENIYNLLFLVKTIRAALMRSHDDYYDLARKRDNKVVMPAFYHIKMLLSQVVKLKN